MVSEEIIKVLEYLGEKYGLAIDWTSKNVMPYIEDLISRIKIYNIAMSISGVLLGIIFLVVTFLLVRYGLKKKKEDEYWDWDMEGMWIIFASVATTTAGIVILIANTCLLIQNIFLPEKAIISMFRNLL